MTIDREKAAAFGVTFEDINNTISTNLGSAYIDDFPNRGRMQRVIVQSDDQRRMQADGILKFSVRNSQGQLGAARLVRVGAMGGRTDADRGFNRPPFVRISGSARPGYSSGDAIVEMERLAATLPRGFGFERAGQSLQERLSGSQAPLLGLSRWSCSCASRRSTKAGRFRWRSS